MTEVITYMFDYNVIINRKNIKNIYIRIDDDLNVVVNANKNIENDYIYSILKEKEPWIKKRIDDMSKNSHIKDLDCKNISILGREYLIRIIKSNKNIIEIKDKILYIFTEYEDISEQIKIINEYLKEIFVNLLNDELINSCIAEMERFKIKKDFNLKIKLMKSRLGSYSLKTNTICLNLCLIKYNKDIIKSVIFHEMCHIKQMNHQKGFYNMLYKVCPDYDDYSRIIKKDFKYSNTWFLF